MKIGYQGSIGSYSYEATSIIFKNEKKIQGFTLSEDVFNELKNEQIQKAVLPIENSIIGNIDINTELIQSNDVHIIGEHYLPIKHYLYGLDGENLTSIKQVYSHPAALAQCHNYLTQKKIIPMVEFDTGGACQKLKKGKYERGTGVIAGPTCSQLFPELSVLGERIQNNQSNYTRFVVIEKTNKKPSYFGNKFSLSLTTGHNPGALLDVLTLFKDLEVNLTKLESMPIPDTPFEYTFFIDGEFSKEDNNFWPNLKKALVEKKVNYKFLGIYQSHKRNLWKH